MGTEKVGYLDDPNILPCVGNDAFGPIPNGDLALPLEGILLSLCLPNISFLLFIRLTLVLMGK